MPTFPITVGTGARPTKCYLIQFDENGREKDDKEGQGNVEEDGRKLLSQTVTAELEKARDDKEPFTDIFIISHGWHSDFDEASKQYRAWCESMAAMAQKAGEKPDNNFKALVVGFHWPSLEWGKEDVPKDYDTMVAKIAKQIAKNEEGTSAIENRFRPVENAQDMDAALQTLIDHADLPRHGSPGEFVHIPELPGLIKDVIKNVWTTWTKAVADEREQAKQRLLWAQRLFGYYKMKDRARAVGEGAGAKLLYQLQNASKDSHVHLMGHSFGCIVVSGMVLKANLKSLEKKVHTLFLVQGALSLWSFAKTSPYWSSPGHFYPIISDKLVSGVIMATTSQSDTALKISYPVASVLKEDDPSMYRDQLPKFGAVGIHGIQGVPGIDIYMLPEDKTYDFAAHQIYNIKADKYIDEGQFPNGSHSDITDKEVAHAFWAAVKLNCD